MTISKSEVHARITHLLQSIPVHGDGQSTVLEWITKADVLVENIEYESQIGEIEDGIFDVKQGYLNGQTKRIDEGILTIQTSLVRSLYRLELGNDIESKGNFIPAGNEVDAMAAVGNLFSRSVSELLLIDPYLDETVFTDFLRYVPPTAVIKLLSIRKVGDALKVPLKRWRNQYSNSNVEVRLCDNKALHDRVVIIDTREVWLLSQSFNGIAKRSHAYIVRADTELSNLKLHAYAQLWLAANEMQI